VGQRRIERLQQAAHAEQAALWPAWRLAYAAQLTCAPSGMDEVSAEILKRLSHTDRARADREAKVHADLIRDVFGNPFRPMPALSGSIRTWNGGVVVQLAQAIYQDRAFERLPILADALEEAGCDRLEVIEHLRGPGPHARGCWALDLVLGKRVL
jgi:hypothetical protein